jgi:D-serine deaminase-like pyridoxal phosphate-dependent protein
MPLPSLKSSLPTPALVIDLDALERNLDRMSAVFSARKAGLRPHAKTHKSPIVARLQLARGALGVCVAKLSEAEVMVDAGIDEVLITTAVVDVPRLERLADLAARAPGLMIVTDHAANIDRLAEASASRRTRVKVLVDLDCGSNRTGVAPGAGACDLARRIARHPGLELKGFQAFASNVMHLTGPARRARAHAEILASVLETRRMAEREGLEVEIVSVGGTGTYATDADAEGVTEVQAGSYVFMDVMYRAIGGAAGPVFDDFDPALFVLCTAISQPVPGRITVDAGYKASATDHQPPEPWGIGDVTYQWAGDEHGILHLRNPSREIRIGDTIELLPGHCDPTVNLYDRYYVCRGDHVVDVWPVAARGKSQ